MATKAEELIAELKVEVAVLKTEVATLRGMSTEVSQLSKQFAVLESQNAQLTKTREVWGQRGGAVFTVAVSAGFSLLTGTLTAGLAYYLNLKK